MLCQITQGYASVTQRTSATLMPNNDDESRCVRLHVAKSLTGFKLCATTPNNAQQHVQKDAKCNIQQCWKLLANIVASVCTWLYSLLCKATSCFDKQLTIPDALCGDNFCYSYFITEEINAIEQIDN